MERWIIQRINVTHMQAEAHARSQRQRGAQGGTGGAAAPGKALGIRIGSNRIITGVIYPQIIDMSMVI